MRKWVTEYDVVDQNTVMVFAGEDIAAPSFELAQKLCDDQNKGLRVIGELLAEVPCKKGSYEPDMAGKVDYDQINMN